MFKSSNDFCLYLERLKEEQELETYLETVVWYTENESDMEYSQIVKHLNKRILDKIHNEANIHRLVKDYEEEVNIL